MLARSNSFSCFTTYHTLCSHVGPNIPASLQAPEQFYKLCACLNVHEQATLHLPQCYPGKF